MAFRDGPFETIKVPLVWTAAVVVVVAMVASLVLIFTDRKGAAEANAYTPVRAGFDAATGRVGGVLSAPVRWTGAVTDGVKGYFFAVSENRRLKAELAEMQQWRSEAIALKNVNGRYEALLGLRTEPAVPTVAARSVLDARGPFGKARLIDVGSDRGVRIGNPVINEQGLVGRVVGVSGGISRMLLVTDVSSRLPVLIDRTDARAIMTGDGSRNPRLEYIRGVGALQVGDRILSSGDGGGLPRGLPIGVAAKGVDGSWRVKLFSDRGAIDYVRVMLFQSFGQLISPEALNAAPLSGLSTAPAPDAAQIAAIRDAEARRAAAAAAAAQRAAAANAAPAPAAAPAPTPTPTRATASAPAPAAAARPAPSRPTAAALNGAPASTTNTPAPAPATPAPVPPAGAPR